MMKAFKFKLDRKSLEIIYMSFIRPSLEYADVLFAGTYDSDLCKLDMLQAEAMRIVTGATARSNIRLLYEDLGWPTLQSRRRIHCLCLMYKIVNGNAPQYLKALIPVRYQPDGMHSLRSFANEEIRAPFARTESFTRSFLLYTIKLWNELDIETRHLPTLDSFKLALKEPKDRMLSILYYGKRWPNIHHARIRIGCSKLNNHLCNNLHVLPSPQCNCGWANEDPMHFLFMCPHYNAQRNILMNNISNIPVAINLDNMLYGDPDATDANNYKLFEAVHQYILDTKRFE
jgi:hypothetical protein